MNLTAKGQMIAETMATLEEIIEAAKPPTIETTQNHYAHYASVIDAIGRAISDDTATGHTLAAEALKLAGGNAKGIDSAMSVMLGYNLPAGVW